MTTPEKVREEAMNDNKQLFAIINSTPILQSLLYDLNLLPEQLKEHTKEWDYMMTTVHHFKLSQESQSSIIEGLKEEIETLREIAKSHSYRLGKSLNRAACELPDGFAIELYIERGYGVYNYFKDGEPFEVDDLNEDRMLAENLNAAIDAAIATLPSPGKSNNG